MKRSSLSGHNGAIFCNIGPRWKRRKRRKSDRGECLEEANIKIEHARRNGATTFIKTTVSITALSLKAFSIMTFSLKDIQHNGIQLKEHSA